jgi:hypothetical protein
MKAQNLIPALVRDIYWQAELVRNPSRGLDPYTQRKNEHTLRTLCGQLSPNLIVIHGGVPVCIAADEQDVRDFIYAALRGVEHQATVWSRDEDGQPQDITEAFARRWFDDTGAAFEADWDDWFSQFPAYVQAHLTAEAIEVWQAAADERENQRQVA